MKNYQAPSWKVISKILECTEKGKQCFKTSSAESIVRIFSSHDLTQEEHEALSHGFDHHIPTNINRNNIKTEFESFFQNILYDLSDMSEIKLIKWRQNV